MIQSNLVIGICRKAKPSFSEVGHGHGENDGKQGQCSRSVVSKAIQSFSVFETLVKNAFRKEVIILIT
jgi:hypothetical protein